MIRDDMILHFKGLAEFSQPGFYSSPDITPSLAYDVSIIISILPVIK